MIERAWQAQFDRREILYAARSLFEQQGRARITELADRFRYSGRQLERKFGQQAGVSPKALARKVRFEKVRDHLTRNPQAPLAALAQEYGYADQAHLARDFKQFSDKTPVQFASEMSSLREAMGAVYYVVFLQDESSLG